MHMGCRGFFLALLEDEVSGFGDRSELDEVHVAWVLFAITVGIMLAKSGRENHNATEEPHCNKV